MLITLACAPLLGTIGRRMQAVYSRCPAATGCHLRTDARGVITTCRYDPLNRLQQISYNVGATGVAATPVVNFTYGTSAAQKNNGRLLTMTDGVGSETYSYDILGRMTQ